MGRERYNYNVESSNLKPGDAICEDSNNVLESKEDWNFESLVLQRLYHNVNSYDYDEDDQIQMTVNFVSTPSLRRIDDRGGHEYANKSNNIINWSKLSSMYFRLVTLFYLSWMLFSNVSLISCAPVRRPYISTSSVVSERIYYDFQN